MSDQDVRVVHSATPLPHREERREAVGSIKAAREGAGAAVEERLKVEGGTASALRLGALEDSAVLTLIESIARRK